MDELVGGASVGVVADLIHTASHELSHFSTATAPKA